MNQEHTNFLAELIEKERAGIMNGADLTDAELIRNRCSPYSQAFAERFGLTLCRGWYVLDYPNQQPDEKGHATEHWWCEDAQGNIIDPTASQFRPGGRYSKFESGEFKMRIGACPNCGGDLYDGDGDFCSDECFESYTAYITREAVNLGR